MQFCRGLGAGVCNECGGVPLLTVLVFLGGWGSQGPTLEGLLHPMFLFFFCLLAMPILLPDSTRGFMEPMHSRHKPFCSRISALSHSETLA